MEYLPRKPPPTAQPRHDLTGSSAQGQIEQRFGGFAGAGCAGWDSHAQLCVELPSLWPTGGIAVVVLGDGAATCGRQPDLARGTQLIHLQKNPPRQAPDIQLP